MSNLCQEPLVYPCRCSGISASFAACWDRPLLSLKGVILQHQFLLGPISHPGPYVKRSKTTFLLMQYMIPKPEYVQVRHTIVSHFGSPRLIQPALKPESRTSIFLPWKEGPESLWDYQPCWLPTLLRSHNDMGSHKDTGFHRSMLPWTNQLCGLTCVCWMKEWIRKGKEGMSSRMVIMADIGIPNVK